MRTDLYEALRNTEYVRFSVLSSYWMGEKGREEATYKHIKANQQRKWNTVGLRAPQVGLDGWVWDIICGLFLSLS